MASTVPVTVEHNPGRGDWRSRTVNLWIDRERVVRVRLECDYAVRRLMTGPVCGMPAVWAEYDVLVAAYDADAAEARADLADRRAEYRESRGV